MGLKKDRKAPRKGAQAPTVLLTGSDPRNGIVTLSQNGKVFTVTNGRTGYTATAATRTEGEGLYNHQVGGVH